MECRNCWEEFPNHRVGCVEARYICEGCGWPVTQEDLRNVKVCLPLLQYGSGLECPLCFIKTLADERRDMGLVIGEE